MIRPSFRATTPEQNNPSWLRTGVKVWLPGSHTWAGVGVCQPSQSRSLPLSIRLVCTATRGHDMSGPHCPTVAGKPPVVLKLKLAEVDVWPAPSVLTTAKSYRVPDVRLFRVWLWLVTRVGS